MNKIIKYSLIYFISLFYINAFAGTNSYVTSKKIQPPGTVLLKGTKMYVDVTEVTNFYYLESLEYYKNTKTANPNAYKILRPDSAILRADYPNIGYTHPYYWKYSNDPMVGITRKQVTQYCKFRTAVVDSFMAIKYPRWHKEYKIVYKLPTAKQWEEIAQSRQAVHKKTKPKLYSVHKVRHHLLASRKIYGLFDNVSEYVFSSDYTAMGGELQKAAKSRSSNA